MIALAYLAWWAAIAFWLRHQASVFQRLNDMHWQLLVLIDIIAAFLLFWPLYVARLLKERPLPWATISAIRGGNVGRPWADRAAALIDAVFFVLTSQRGHCAKSYARWSNPLGAG
jgi:hypothetical protein